MNVNFFAAAKVYKKSILPEIFFLKFLFFVGNDWNDWNVETHGRASLPAKWPCVSTCQQQQTK
ncbi:MAG: hypothetical protein DRJ05_07515 [Bacteroidetes bacterium]|nr:MAG: hypothetical protein DRJ05_07515 [Bacteroidota bacterium]